MDKRRRGTISRSNVETTNKILLRENEPPSKSLKERRSNDQSVVKCEMRAIFERWLATFTPVLWIRVASAQVWPRRPPSPPPLREEGGWVSCACRIQDLLRGDLLPSHQGPTPFHGGGAATRCNPPPATSWSTRKPRKRVLINHQFPRAICEGSSLAADTARQKTNPPTSTESMAPVFRHPGDICRGRASSTWSYPWHARFRSSRFGNFIPLFVFPF